MSGCNHSLSPYVTIMVKKKLLTHWSTRCYHFRGTIGYHSNNIMPVFRRQICLRRGYTRIEVKFEVLLKGIVSPGIKMGWKRYQT